MNGQFKPGDRRLRRDWPCPLGSVCLGFRWPDRCSGARVDGTCGVDKTTEPAPDPTEGEHPPRREQIARALCGAQIRKNMAKWDPGRPYPQLAEDSAWEQWAWLADAILPLFAPLQERVSQAVQSEREAQRDHTDMMWQRRRAEEHAEAAEARALAAEQALEPFAAYGAKRDRIEALRQWPDDHSWISDIHGTQITVGDLRRAASVIRSTPIPPAHTEEDDG